MHLTNAIPRRLRRLPRVCASSPPSPVVSRGRHHLSHLTPLPHTCTRISTTMGWVGFVWYPLPKGPSYAGKSRRRFSPSPFASFAACAICLAAAGVRAQRHTRPPSACPTSVSTAVSCTIYHLVGFSKANSIWRSFATQYFHLFYPNAKPYTDGFLLSYSNVSVCCNVDAANPVLPGFPFATPNILLSFPLSYGSGPLPSLRLAVVANLYCWLISTVCGEPIAWRITKGKTTTRHQIHTSER